MNIVDLYQTVGSIPDCGQYTIFILPEIVKKTRVEIIQILT